jgi:hypothetical protein
MHVHIIKGPDDPIWPNYNRTLAESPNLNWKGHKDQIICTEISSDKSFYRSRNIAELY